MNRISQMIPLHLLRPAIAALSLGVLVATVTATLLSPSTASAVSYSSDRQALSLESCRGELLEARRGLAEARKRRTKTAESKKKKTAGKTLTGVLNINTASTKQLMMLPGVGPAKAERVVEYRKRKGNFARVKDLRRVKGFGYKSVKKLARWLTVKGKTTLARK
jgi:competence protein ComEA